MIKKVIKFLKKNKISIIFLILGLILMLASKITWTVFYEKNYLFEQQEKKFEEVARRYYEYRSQYLPNKGEYRELTLQQMYDQELIDDLYAPKSRKMCDVNSRVRVYLNEDNEYVFNTYLKCGKYESDVDYLGPTITLKGEETTYIIVGNEYTEEGIEKVVDDKDGEINIEKVIIDSKQVDTSKTGTYKVTYSIIDSSYNKTIKTRKVVVGYGLTDTVRKNVGADGYYKGNNSNNYILFSGIMWRIINVNEDGSIKIISDEPIANLNANYTTYENSNVDTYLKEYFYKKLNNPDDYVVEKSYCVGDINSIADYASECSTQINSKIGLLTLGDYYKASDGSTTSIDSGYFLIGNRINSNFVQVPDNNINYDNQANILPSIRPVITLKNGIFVLSGKGTYDSPYKLDDYEYGKNAEQLNTRLVGEYINYSGYLFRIAGIDENKNVKLVMNKSWAVQPYNLLVMTNTANIESWKFDINDSNNPGYILNSEYIEYLDTKSIIETEYDIPINDPTKKYNEYEKDIIKTKITLPKSYELFAAIENKENNYNYLYIDQFTDKNYAFINDVSTGLVRLIDKNQTQYSTKIVFTIKGNLKISSGNGTKKNPYIIK